MSCTLSVIICTTGRNDFLKRCLSSLNRQKKINFQVILVCRSQNDLSGLNTEKVRFPVKVVVSPDRNLSLARDLGWRASEGKYVAWIDDDTEISRGWSEAIVNIFQSNPDIGGLSGPTIIPEDYLRNRDVFHFYRPEAINSLLAKFYFWWFMDGSQFSVGRLFPSGAWSPGSNFPSALKVEEKTEVDYLEACNMILRKELVKKAGGFDLSYQGTSEWSELDLAFRIKNLRYRLVFSPRLRIKHLVSTAGAYPERADTKIRMENFLRFYFRHLFRWEAGRIIKFSSYLLFLNLYYFHQAISNKGYWWGALEGTYSGIYEAVNKQKRK